MKLTSLGLTLSRALRIGVTDSVAFVGAGGKTTAIFQIARQLPPPVIISVSTHMAENQLNLADIHVVVDENNGLHFPYDQEFSHVMLFTGSKSEEDRVVGLSLNDLEKLISYAKTRSIPVLIEADGSRLRPLKAPADHEPAIPNSIDKVVVVAGLQGLGKPLGNEWVHRPDLFAKISGGELGKGVTPDQVSRVFIHERGGMKNIPLAARRVALLNQADSDDLRAKANSLASQLIPHYDAVIVSSLRWGYHFTDDEHIAGFTQDGDIDGEIFAVHEQTAGIILAAGGSSRIGKPKQLLDWLGNPLVRHVARNALIAGLSPVILVTGAYRELVRETIVDLPVSVIHNSNWESGQASSIQMGLGLLPMNVGGVVFLLADQPQIPVALIRAIIEKHTTDLSPIIAPMIDGQRANPVLFDRSTFHEFSTLQGDTGGRSLFSRYQIDWIDWYGRDLLLDVDTEDDYKKLLKIQQG